MKPFLVTEDDDQHKALQDERTPEPESCKEKVLNRRPRKRLATSNLEGWLGEISVTLATACSRPEHKSFYKSKFDRRARTVFELMVELRWPMPTNSPRVACFGGGGGAEVAGLVWARQELHAQADPVLQCALCDTDTTWKRQLKQIGRVCGSGLTLDFVQAPHINAYDSAVARVDFGSFDLLMFSFVVHEAAAAARRARAGGVAGQWTPPDPVECQFFKEVGKLAKPGAVVIFADYKVRSESQSHHGRSFVAGAKTVQDLPSESVRDIATAVGAMVEGRRGVLGGSALEAIRLRAPRADAEVAAFRLR